LHPSVVNPVVRTIAAALALLGAASCGEGDPGSTELPPPAIPAPDPAVIEASIGPEGGTIRHPSGAELFVPKGAVAHFTAIALACAPALPRGELGAESVGYGLIAEPVGLTFAKPVELRLPLDATRVGDSTALVRARMISRATGKPVVVSSRIEGMRVRVSTIRFSRFYPTREESPVEITTLSSQLVPAIVGEPYTVPLPLTPGAPRYVWEPAPGATLPDGLTLTAQGALTGIPEAEGEFSFFARAIRANGAFEHVPFVMTVLPTPMPAPVLDSVTPAKVFVGTPTTILVVHGSSFTSGSVVEWDSQVLPTTVDSDTTLRAEVSSHKLGRVGKHQIAVFTPEPGGGWSHPIEFVIAPRPPPP
jgi:hypothetical protein